MPARVYGGSLARNAGAPSQRRVYTYLGRRVRKTVQAWSNTAYTTALLDRKFLYDGRNLLTESDVASNGSGQILSIVQGLLLKWPL